MKFQHKNSPVFKIKKIKCKWREEYNRKEDVNDRMNTQGSPNRLNMRGVKEVYWSLKNG